MWSYFVIKKKFLDVSCNAKDLWTFNKVYRWKHIYGKST